MSTMTGLGPGSCYRLDSELINYYQWTWMPFNFLFQPLEVFESGSCLIDITAPWRLPPSLLRTSLAGRPVLAGGSAALLWHHVAMVLEAHRDTK